MGTSQPTTTPLAAVRTEQYINLTTYKRDGTAVATPVWFGEQAGKLYVYTSADAGKVKRLRNNTQVTVAACTANGKLKGPAIPAQARIITDGDTVKVAHSLIARKYHIMFAAIQGFGKLATLFNRSAARANAYIEITAS